jgi:sugar phosphate isomerase/epimerase
MKFAMVVSLQETTFKAVTRATTFESLLSYFRELKKLGFDGSELAFANPQELEWERVKEEIQKNDLEIPALGTGQAYLRDGLSFLSKSSAVRKKAIGRVEIFCNYAAEVKARVIIGLIRGKKSQGQDDKDAERLFVSCMRESAEYASLKKIELVIEPLNRYETDFINNSVQGIELIERIGFENVGLLLDTFHMNIEESSFEAALKRSRKLLKHVHLADSNRCAPGYGHLDFETLFENFHRINYSGWGSAEILPVPDELSAARQTANYFRKLIHL